ncbi:hypothetical protein KIW84_020927 [Lathyrus oleraceus]|uniref:Uncharacterized protein n=1 Tax=Pisum sativum TaxID=3888 RepID=A0A9D5B8L9_PEA|nr:hypothetical protein KIW84_020927 [Pisum sativum]
MEFEEYCWDWSVQEDKYNFLPYFEEEYEMEQPMIEEHITPLASPTPRLDETSSSERTPRLRRIEELYKSLLHIATGVEVEKDRRTQKSILRAIGQIEIRADLMDAHYQLKSEVLLNGTPQEEENGTEKGISPKNQQTLSQIPVTASRRSGYNALAAKETLCLSASSKKKFSTTQYPPAITTQFKPPNTSNLPMSNNLERRTLPVFIPNRMFLLKPELSKQYK